MKKRVKAQLLGFGRSSSYMIFKLLTVFLLCLVFNVAAGAAFAETFKQNIFIGEQNESFKDGIMLKNIRDEQEFFFTKPKTWKILDGSNLIIKYQHSSELLPDKSFLKIHLNGKMVKKVALDESSQEIQTLVIPLPVSSLGNYNTVFLSVEQHYTTKCEDPLDPSLWTRIHEDTHVAYNYDELVPKVNLSLYPFPMFDEFGYSPSEVTFILPNKEKISAEALNSAGIIASSIAQKISWRPLKFKAVVGKDTINNKTNNIIIGTPHNNAAISKLKSYFTNNIKTIDGENKVIDSNGNVLADDKGLIIYINNPNNSKKAILLITANNDAGIEAAAKYLSDKEQYKKLTGTKAEISQSSTPIAMSNNLAKYVYNSSMSFEQLGFNDIKVSRIGSSPIFFPIRVMPDMFTSKDKLAIEIDYSYSKDLNPELSSLEVIFNEISLKGVKLNKLEGETNKKLKVYVPPQYVKPYNKLNVKFHLFPAKYEYCKDFYDDNIWGEVSKISKVILPSDAKVILPNLALFNDHIFPYTISQDLSNTAVILTNDLSDEVLTAYINIITSIGKVTDSDTGINLLTFFVNNINDKLLSDRDVILISDKSDSDFLKSIKDKFFVKYMNYYKEFTPYSNSKAVLNYANDQGVLQQIKSVFAKNKVITMFYGKTPLETIYASGAVANKILLSKIKDDKFYTLDAKNIYGVVIPGLKKSEKVSVDDHPVSVDNLWPPSSVFSWAVVIIVSLVFIFVVVYIIKLIFRI